MRAKGFYKQMEMREQWAGSNGHCACPMGCLGKNQWAKLKRLKGKERKMIQPKRGRDKHKPNPSPTLTPSLLSFKLPLKVAYKHITYMGHT